MQNTNELILKFFNLLLEYTPDTVGGLKELALLLWENGDLTDSEHCDIDAILDNALLKFNLARY